MGELGATDRTRVRRSPHRAASDPAVLHDVLDAATVCQVGFLHEGHPVVIPTSYDRDGERVLLHGSAVSRMFQTLAAGAPVCVTVTLLDGLVLARSVFHHSMNYRSAVIFGIAEPITDPDAKLAALRAVTEGLVPGRWSHARPPDRRELAATAVLALPLAEASVKLRRGPPEDNEADHDLEVWAGTIPLRATAGAPVPAPEMAPDRLVPAHVHHYQHQQGRNR